MADIVILLFRLGATHPPRSLRAWSTGILLACCLLSYFLRSFDVDLFLLFLLFHSFFRSRFGHLLFHPVFFLWVLLVLGCCLLVFGFSCDSLNIYFEVYDINMYRDTYVRWSHFFFSLRYAICFRCCVYDTIFCFYMFSIFLFFLVLCGPTRTYRMCPSTSGHIFQKRRGHLCRKQGW